MPQNYTAALGEAVRCRDLVTLGLTGGRFGLRRTSPAERARVDEALARVGASAYADRRMSELSGGQQQRVAIAQAIVDDAELLLLDEPLANLDLRNQQEIVRLLGELHRERDVTIMVVAHDLNPLLPVLTDAIYLLDAHPAPRRDRRGRAGGAAHPPLRHAGRRRPHRAGRPVHPRRVAGSAGDVSELASSPMSTAAARTRATSAGEEVT